MQSIQANVTGMKGGYWSTVNVVNFTGSIFRGFVLFVGCDIRGFLQLTTNWKIYSILRVVQMSYNYFFEFHFQKF